MELQQVRSQATDRVKHFAAARIHEQGNDLNQRRHSGAQSLQLPGLNPAWTFRHHETDGIHAQFASEPDIARPGQSAEFHPRSGHNVTCAGKFHTGG